MIVTILPCGHAGPRRATTARKILLLKHRLAFGSVGLGELGAKNGRTVLYSFPNFAKIIDDNTGDETTVDSLSRIVENESSKAFSSAPRLLNSRDNACYLGKDQALDENLFPLVQYLIAGYESGVPVISTVFLKLTREHDRVLPTRFLIQPLQGQRIDARVDGSLYVRSHLQEMCGTQSNPYSVAFSGFFAQKQILCANDFSGLTLEQACDMVRVLIEVFTKAEPDLIGFPLTIIAIPKKGRAWAKTYTKPFGLPEGRNAKK